MGIKNESLKDSLTAIHSSSSSSSSSSSNRANGLLQPEKIRLGTQTNLKGEMEMMPRGVDIQLKKASPSSITLALPYVEEYKKSVPTDHDKIRQYAEKELPKARSYFEKYAQYGFKSGHDVSSYLITPAGVRLLGLMQKVFNERERLIKQQRQLQSHHHDLKLLAFLMHLITKSKKRHDRKQLDAQDQAELERIQKVLNAAKAAPATRETAYLYSQSIKELERLILLKEQQLVKLDDEINRLTVKSELLSERYDLYADSLEKANDEFFAGTKELPKEELITFMNDYLAKRNELFLDKRKQRIQPYIDKVQEKIMQATKALEVMHIPLDGTDKELENAIRTYNDQYLQVQTYVDMVSVFKGEKVVYNQYGMPATSLDEICFILPNTKRIVLHDNKYYLIDSGRNFNSLSPEDKVKANKAFVKSIDVIYILPKLVLNNRTLELSSIAEKKAELIQNREVVQKSIDTIKHQKEIIQDEARLKNLKLEDVSATDLESTTDSTNLTIGKEKSSMQSTSPTPLSTAPTLKPGSSSENQETAAAEKQKRRLQEQARNNPAALNASRAQDGSIASVAFKQFIQSAPGPLGSSAGPNATATPGASSSKSNLVFKTVSGVTAEEQARKEREHDTKSPAKSEELERPRETVPIPTLTPKPVGSR